MQMSAAQSRLPDGLEGPASTSPVIVDAAAKVYRERVLFITGGYAATRGARPVFSTLREAARYDLGFDSWKWGRDCPSNATEREGWEAAQEWAEKIDAMHVRGCDE